MIGRGSRKLPNKNSFLVIDLGNNALRFGLWNDPVDWQHIFRSPEYYLENLREDAEIENNFRYVMPESLLKMFSRSPQISFDIELEFKICTAKNLRSKDVLDKSIDQHAQMCIENTKEFTQAKLLSKLFLEVLDAGYKAISEITPATSCGIVA